jgi:nitroreductase
VHPTLETLKALRSTHGNFTDRDLPEADLAAVLEACTRAANSSSRQAYSIVLLEDRDHMERVLGYRASRALVFCVDYRRLDLLAARLGHRRGEPNVVELVTGIVDVSVAAQTAVVAARALGIDSLVTNGHHRKPLDLVWRELGLPERSVFPAIAVLLGYAQDPTFRPHRRLPLEHVVHRERYREPGPEELDRMVALYDDREARIGMVDLWDEKRYPHYLDWYFQAWDWKAREEPVETSKVSEFQNRFRASGFWWTDR